MTSVARRYGLVHHGGEVGLSSPAPASRTLADAELGGSQHPANTSPGDQATAKARQRSRAARVVAPGANTRRETAGSRPPHAPAESGQVAMGGAPQSPGDAGAHQGESAAGAPPVVLELIGAGAALHDSSRAPRRVNGRDLRVLDGEPFVRALSLAECRPGVPCRVWAYARWVRGEVVRTLTKRVQVRLLLTSRRPKLREYHPAGVWLRSTWPPGMGPGQAGRCV